MQSPSRRRACRSTCRRRTPKRSAPIASGATSQLTADWWTNFGSPQLTSLIEQALAGSSDIRIAAERITQAELALRQANASLLPSIGLGAGQSFSRSDSPGTDASTRRGTSVSIAMSYEIDLWGRLAAGIQAQEQALNISRFDAETVRLTLTSGVAATYFQLLATRERLDIGRENLATAERVLKVVDARYRNGVATQLDLSQQTTAVLNVRAALIPLEVAERQTVSALALLIGRVPQGFGVAEDNFEELRVPTVGAGLAVRAADAPPRSRRGRSTTRRRRCQRRRRARSAAAEHLVVDIGRTRNVRAVEPGQSDECDLNRTIARTNIVRRRPAARAGRNRTIAAAHPGRDVRQRGTYLAKRSRRRIGNADRGARLEDAQQQTVEQAQRSLRLAEIRYREGAGDLLAVLDAQRSLFSAQDQLAQSRLERLTASIDLFKALGGGWTAPEATAEIAG